MELLKSQPNWKFRLSQFLKGYRQFLKGYECSKSQHVDWKATKVFSNPTCMLCKRGGAAPRYFVMQAACWRKTSHSDLRPFCANWGAAAMQAQCQTAVSKKLRLVIFVHFLEMGKASHSLTSPLFCNANILRNTSIKGVQGFGIGVLIFVNVSQMFHNASTMQKTQPIKRCKKRSR